MHIDYWKAEQGNLITEVLGQMSGWSINIFFYSLLHLLDLASDITSDVRKSEPVLHKGTDDFPWSLR